MVSYGTPPLQQGATDAGLVRQLQVRQLQHDLHALGYLAGGVDGDFGPGTTTAVRRLQYDLLHNGGAGKDGTAPLAINRYRGDVAGITGVVDSALAAAIQNLLVAPGFVQVPRSGTPDQANQAALAAVRAMGSPAAPIPFMLAIFRQETGSRHFAVPSATDANDYVVVGFDNNAESADVITSRGYGLGQYTLFHHPPTAQELQDFILDPLRNVSAAFAKLKDAFWNYVAGPKDIADDRNAEHPLLKLRVCAYDATDPRYMTDCKACAGAAPKLDIGPQTPLYHGADQTYGPTKVYGNKSYEAVPDRAEFPCDWPYAVRRYNGGGPESYNYQAIVLGNLLGG